MQSKPTTDQMNAINEALFVGQKIEAIKLYRNATGHDLKESKEFVEKLATELYTQHPEMFSAGQRQQVAAARGIGIVFAIIVAVIIVIILIMK